MSNRRNVISETYSTNEDLEVLGAWLELGPSNDDGSGLCRIRLARMGGQNKKFDKARDIKFKKYRVGSSGQINVDKIPERVRIPILRELYADTIVTEWEHFYDDDGEELPFNKENVVKLFTDNPDFFLECMMFAADRSNYQDSTEEDVKN